jgi:sterol desaturase/sphingolipid hydroxylase (fatty acid hydroxylase superfamily)
MCMKPKGVLAKPMKAQGAKLVNESKAIAPTHSAHERQTKHDLFLFLVPLLFSWATPVLPVYIIGIVRMISTRLTLALHYMLVDKDNYNNKITQKQLEREKSEYLVGTVLHMWTQVLLQIIFPGMFFTDNSFIGSCAVHTLLSHIFVVEPLYYIAHRFLHIPEVMKRMHGFHHLSINTLPSTSLVQNFEEHFVYIATFGPAFLLPFFLGGHQHWMVIGAYLVLFDLNNAWGHTNVRIRNPMITHKYSPLKYLFYTPEFHLGHHAYFQANYGLFMPIWDYMFGTAREYKKPDQGLAPANKQDFVFIGHNGGLGHLLTCPEFSVYNVYDSYRFMLPIEVEILMMHFFCSIARLFVKFYYCPRYLINNELVGRVICILRTPWDYASPKSYKAMNGEIIALMREQYTQCGTTKFGLGNWNKMKQLNNGGVDIVELVKKDEVLKDKNIRVWTGDTLTAASVFYQLMEFTEVKEIFFIGANGKIGIAVCTLLLRERPDMKIRILSRYQSMQHPNISYTENLSDMLDYEVVVVGKILPGRKYETALRGSTDPGKTRLVLDYSVPFIPLHFKQHRQIKHIQIGLLESVDRTFLKGSFDVCMSHDQNHIYPCHACCIINTAEDRQTDETGDIVLDDVETYWEKALSYGLRNRDIKAML